MKNKLHKIGFFFIASVFTSLLFLSCTNDEMESEENANLKLKNQVELSIQTIDSTKVNVQALDSESQGDPSNPKPPRH